MNEDQGTQRIDLAKTLTLIAHFLTAFVLILAVISLRPIAKWANYQSICVEQESVKAPISWAVRKCNGRSKVYQVK